MPKKIARERLLKKLGGSNITIDDKAKFNVPKKIYKNVLNDIQKPKPLEIIQALHHDKHVSKTSQLLCHSNPKENYCVTSKNGLKKSANFMKAAKQAFEMRDYKALYRICIKGFELNDKSLNKNLYEYLQLAIENDPVIPNNRREAFLMEAVQSCKIINVQKGSAPREFTSDKAALEHIRNIHMLKRALPHSDNDVSDNYEAHIKIEKVEEKYETFYNKS